MRFVVRECNVADGRLSLVGDYSVGFRAGGAEHAGWQGRAGCEQPAGVGVAAVDVPGGRQFPAALPGRGRRCTPTCSYTCRGSATHERMLRSRRRRRCGGRAAGGGARRKEEEEEKEGQGRHATPTPSTPVTLATPAAATPAASATPAANGHANGTGGSKEAPSAVSGKKAKRDRPVATPADAAAGAATAAAATAAGSGKKAKREKKKKDQDGAESAHKQASAPNI